MAEAIGIPYKRTFSCCCLTGTCKKCIPFHEDKLCSVRDNTQPLIRKRKRIDFTIEDLEAAAEDYNDSNFTEYFDQGDCL